MILGPSLSIPETGRGAHPVARAHARRAGRRGRFARALGICVLLIGSMPHRAAADLKLCNSSTSRIGVAIGYQDGDGWTTEGWWTIASQTCETLLKGTLSSRYYYVHAVD